MWNWALTIAWCGMSCTLMGYKGFWGNILGPAWVVRSCILSLHCWCSCRLRIPLRQRVFSLSIALALLSEHLHNLGGLTRIHAWSVHFVYIASCSPSATFSERLHTCCINIYKWGGMSSKGSPIYEVQLSNWGTPSTMGSAWSLGNFHT